VAVVQPTPEARCKRCAALQHSLLDDMDTAPFWSLYRLFHYHCYCCCCWCHQPQWGCCAVLRCVVKGATDPPPPPLEVESALLGWF